MAEPYLWALLNLSPVDLSSDRRVLDERDEDHLLDLELRENGGIRLFCGRLRFSRSSDNRPFLLDRDLVKSLGIHITLGMSCAQFVEEAHHGSRRIEVELPTAHITNPEAVNYSSRDVDE
jgi:hypothetical protein